jgi:hypothetical protein
LGLERQIATQGRLQRAYVALVCLGPIVVRLYAELLIVVFRINDSLSDIRSLAIWTAEREDEYGATTLEDEQD